MSKELSKLEQNNLMTQIDLMEEIIQNYGNIIYHIEQKAEEIRELLSKKELSDNNSKCTISKESFDKILDTIYTLQDRGKYGKLGILAEEAVPMNEKLKGILKKLRNG